MAAPVFVLLGIWTRPAALVMAINMIVAVALQHRAQIFTLDKITGAWAIELPALYFLGSLALIFLGAGRYSFFRGQGTLD